MKTGKTLSELANEIERRHEVAEDFIADTKQIGIEVVQNYDVETESPKEGATVMMNIPGQGQFDINETAHHQIASRNKIPTKYYDRMLSEAPELLVSNVRQWFDNESKRNLVRTLDGSARAFLSDRYRAIDNNGVLMSGLEAMSEMDDAYLLSSQVTDNRMYLKILFPQIEGEVRPGDTVHPGVILSNSEVGQGSLSVKGFFYRDFCTNGCVFGSGDMFDFSRRHLGARIAGGANSIVLQDDTIEAENVVIAKSIRDTMQAASSDIYFQGVLKELREATEGEIITDPETAIQVLAKEMSLTDTERKSALINLIEDRDLSRYGALNAVTKIANSEAVSYERASELEQVGSKILQMKPAQWNKIAVAA